MKRMFLYALCTVFALQSCDKGEETPPPAKLTLSSTVLNCPAQAKDTSITVTAVGEWKLAPFTTEGDWCTATPAGKELKLSLKKNEGTEIRTVKLTLSAGTVKAELTVNQAGQAAPVVAPDDLANLVATPGKGEVTLSWDEPTGVAYTYVELKYTNPRTGAKTVKINHPATSFKVTDLLNKDGEYTFTLQPYGASDVAGKLETIKATCEKVDATTVEKSEKVTLTVEMLSSNAPDPSEGNFADLIDGDAETFFSTAWQGDIPEAPHWIDIALPEGQTITTFVIKTLYRYGAASPFTPAKVTILGSNDNSTWTEIGNFIDEDPNYGTGHTTEQLTNGTAYRYIRYRCDENMGFYFDKPGHVQEHFDMGDLEIEKFWTEDYDPENE